MPHIRLVYAIVATILFTSILRCMEKDYKQNQHNNDGVAFRLGGDTIPAIKWEIIEYSKYEISDSAGTVASLDSSGKWTIVDCPRALNVMVRLNNGYRRQLDSLRNLVTNPPEYARHSTDY